MNASEIFNLPRHKFSLAATFLLGLFPSAILFLFIFNNPLFANLDIFRLIIIALAITVPAMIFIFLFVSLLIDPGKAKQGIARVIFDTYALMTACLFTTLVFTIVNLLGYFFHFKMLVAIVIVCGLIIFIGILSYWSARKEKVDAKR